MQSGYMPEVDTLTYQGIFNGMLTISSSGALTCSLRSTEHRYFVGEKEKQRIVAAQTLPLIYDGNPWLVQALQCSVCSVPHMCLVRRCF